MIPIEKYPSVSLNDTLFKAMEVIEQSVLEVGDTKSLPRVILVFGEENNLVGLVTRRNILRGLEPKYLVKRSLQSRKNLFDVKEDPKLSELQNKRIIRGVFERAERPVSDVMTSIESTVDYDDHIFKAVYEMNQFQVSQLPVMHNDKVVGIVRTVEIFNAIAEELKSR